MPGTVILAGPSQRAYAHELIDRADDGSVVSFRPPRRSTEQNAMLWALLTDVSDAQPEGRQWPPETWKCAFMHALGHQVRFVDGLDGSGPFPIGFRSSRLTKAQMGDLITAIIKYGDEQGVRWRASRGLEVVDG